MLLFYDLVPRAGGPYFSPFTTIVRLALLHKGLPFKTIDLTYKQLRLDGWSDKIGRNEKGTVTVPFIEREDGTFIRDSLEITCWLDGEYADKPSIHFPDTSSPVNVTSPEYEAAIADSLEWRKKYFPDDAYRSLFYLYAPRITAMMDREEGDNDYDYFTSDVRLGEGVWQKCLNADPEQLITSVNAGFIDTLEQLLSSPPDRQFLHQPYASGFKDFCAMGFVRMIAGTSAENYKKTFAKGKVGEWVQRMNKRYAEGHGGMCAVTARDPQ